MCGISGYKKKTFYHYTTEEGADGIKENGVIKASLATPLTDDAVAGSGVYVTTLPPSTPNNVLLVNNYGGNLTKEENPKNMSHVVELKIKKKKLRRFDQYYHYTNKEGAKGIKESKEIKASDPNIGDAASGEGVYFTKLGPDNKDTVLLKNNYGWNLSKEEDRKNVSHYVEITVPSDKAGEFKEVGETDRDVHLYEDGDIDITEFGGKVKKRESVK